MPVTSSTMLQQTATPALTIIYFQERVSTEVVDPQTLDRVASFTQLRFQR
jgi:hypothetical protein